MSYIIFKKGDKYFDCRYRLGNIPHLFPSWQDLHVLMNPKVGATHLAVVLNTEIIDLDSLEWEKIE